MNDTTQRCPKRSTCARYTQRAKGEGILMQWLCPTQDSYYGMYIEEVKQ